MVFNLSLWLHASFCSGMSKGCTHGKSWNCTFVCIMSLLNHLNKRKCCSAAPVCFEWVSRAAGGGCSMHRSFLQNPKSATWSRFVYHTVNIIRWVQEQKDRSAGEISSYAAELDPMVNITFAFKDLIHFDSSDSLSQGSSSDTTVIDHICCMFVPGVTLHMHRF